MHPLVPDCFEVSVPVPCSSLCPLLPCSRCHLFVCACAVLCSRSPATPHLKYVILWPPCPHAYLLPLPRLRSYLCAGSSVCVLNYEHCVILIWQSCTCSSLVRGAGAPFLRTALRRVVCPILCFLAFLSPFVVAPRWGAPCAPITGVLRLWGLDQCLFVCRNV